MLTPRSYPFILLLFQFYSGCPASILVSEQTSICWSITAGKSQKISPKKKKKPKFWSQPETSRTHNQVSKSLATTKREETHVKTHRRPRPTTANINPLAAETHRLALSCRQPISHQTKNRGVWKSTRASNGIRPPRTTYANSQLTPLPPCHFMLHRFHRAPICTIEHCRQWPPVSPYHFSPIDSSAAHDCSATSLLFSFFCF